MKKMWIVFRGENNYYVLEEYENPDRTYKNKPLAVFFDKDLAYEYVFHKNKKPTNGFVVRRRKKEDSCDTPDRYFNWENEILNG